MIKRYDLKYGWELYFAECPDGEYVKFSDIEHLINELKEANLFIKKAFEVYSNLDLDIEINGESHD